MVHALPRLPAMAPNPLEVLQPCSQRVIIVICSGRRLEYNRLSYWLRKLWIVCAYSMLLMSV